VSQQTAFKIIDLQDKCLPLFSACGKEGESRAKNIVIYLWQFQNYQNASLVLPLQPQIDYKE
jgi:hypothetical protein